MPRPESESGLPPYSRAASFGDNEPLSRRVYVDAQEAIRADRHSELSVYRAQLSRAYVVIALGAAPSGRLDRLLRRLLAQGEPVTIADDLLRMLYERRQRSIQLGSWVERHFRP